MNLFVCPYSFANITGNSCSYLLIHFSFKFYYPIVNIIVNHRYLAFFRSRKTNTNCCDKNKKKHSDMILGCSQQYCSQPARDVPRTSPEGPLKVLTSGTSRGPSGDCQGTNKKIDNLMKKVLFRWIQQFLFYTSVTFFTGKTPRRLKLTLPW